MLFAVVSAPLVVAYVIACFRDPLRWALPPYAVMIPFSSLIAIGSGPFGSLSSLLGLLLGVSLVVQLVTTRRGAAVIPVAIPVWLAYLALSGFTLFWSIAPGVTIDDFKVLASQVLLFVALVLTRFDKNTLRRFGTSVLAGGVLVVCYFLAQATVLGGLPGRAAGISRYGDDLLGANNQAASLLLPLAIAAHRAMSGSRNSRWLYGGASLLLLLGVIMTGSRGGLLASLAVLGIVLFLGPLGRTIKIAVSAVVVLMLGVVLIVQPAGLGARQVDRAERTTTSTVSSGRTDIWAVGLHGCKVYCLTGAGGGAFGQVYLEELASVPEARVQERGSTFEPHNIFLLAVVEVGVGGLLLLVLGLVTALVSAVRLPRSLRAPPIAALLGTVLSSFFLSNLEFKFFWAVLAYVAISETVAAASGTGRGIRLPAQIWRRPEPVSAESP
jgi:O-antigen ligase